jgi:hypothetical protein
MINQKEISDSHMEKSETDHWHFISYLLFQNKKEIYTRSFVVVYEKRVDTKIKKQN